MTITNSFRNAVKSEDIRGIRIMMKDSLLVDRSFEEYKEMETLVQGVRGLYDLHDGREFESDKLSWNDDYMNKLMVQVVRNFSHERLDHLKEVVRHLRPVSESTIGGGYKQSESPTKAPLTQYQRQKQQDGQDGKIKYTRNTKIAAGAAIGGAAGAAMATVAGSSIVLGTALGAVAVGAAVAITTSER